MTKPMTIHEYYRDRGFMFMASVERLPMGPIQHNDWNEEEMCPYRWSVIGPAEKRDMEMQNLATGWGGEIDQDFRFFYCVVALD